MSERIIQFGNAIVKISAIDAAIFRDNTISILLRSGKVVSMPNEQGQDIETIKEEYSRFLSGA